MDEKGFAMGLLGKTKVVISRHEKNTSMTQCGNREWVSLIECISIDGRALTPWIIFKAKRQQAAWFEKLKEGHIAITDNGWTDNELGLRWLKDCFNVQTKSSQRGLYRMLVLDGHASHISTKAIDFCVENKIVLACLPPHSTHLLQPLDVGVFCPLATHYRNGLQSYTRLGASYSIDKVDFIHLYQEARAKTLVPEIIRKSWAKTGLFPYDPQVVLGQLAINTVIDTRPQTPPELTFKPRCGDSVTVEITPKNRDQIQLILKHVLEGILDPTLMIRKLASAATFAMANSDLQRVTIDEFIKLNQRKQARTNRSKTTYGEARIMSKEDADTRRTNEQIRMEKKEAKIIYTRIHKADGMWKKGLQEEIAQARKNETEWIRLWKAFSSQSIQKSQVRSLFKSPTKILSTVLELQHKELPEASPLSRLNTVAKGERKREKLGLHSAQGLSGVQGKQSQQEESARISSRGRLIKKTTFFDSI
jgi:hypothetical protein